MQESGYPGKVESYALIKTAMALLQPIMKSPGKPLFTTSWSLAEDSEDGTRAPRTWPAEVLAPLCFDLLDSPAPSAQLLK